MWGVGWGDGVTSKIHNIRLVQIELSEGWKKALVLCMIAITIGCVIIVMPGMVAPPTQEENNNFTTLIKDFDDLPDIKDGIDPEEMTAKARILLLLQSDDPEIKRAFKIMQEYGRPSNFTNYDFPTHNTQLEVLLWLAEEREISEYDRIALAIALDYGAVLAISDEEVKNTLKDYVLNLYDYFVETDMIVPWDIKEYSLEEDIALVWGANGINYPLFFEEVGQYPEGTKYSKIGVPRHYNLNWIDAFRDDKMGMGDFNWLFVDVGTLREIREFLMHDMFSREFEKTGIDAISSGLDFMLVRSTDYYTDYPSDEVHYVEIEDKITPGCGLSNPDWHWEHFKEEGRIVGNCRDVACMSGFFMKSLGIPAITIFLKSNSFWHRVVVFYNIDVDLWKITDNQQETIECHVKTPYLRVEREFPILWRNWHGDVHPACCYEELKEELESLKDGVEIDEV